MRRYVAVVIAGALALAVALVSRGQLRGPDAVRSSGGGVRVVPPESLKSGAQVQPVDSEVREPSAAAVPPARPGIPPKPADSTHSPPASPTPGTPAGAQQSDPVRVLRQAAAAYANLRSLRADFVQSQENPLLGKRTESRGTISQRRPDRFLMKFSQPAGDVVVSDGEYFWIYYPSVDRKQVLRTRAAAAGGLDLQAQFIGDPTRRFTYTHHGRDVVGGRTAEVFTLVPKEPAGYRALKVWLDQRDGLARQFELTNDNGVMQRFELSNLELNPVLSDALFRFVPPADARIVER